MELILEFFGGGPLDGKVKASDQDHELNGLSGKLIGTLIEAGIDEAARKEEAVGTLLRWRQPSAAVAERARAENWSPAQIEALMEYHLYDITEFERVEGLMMLKAHYRGVE